MILKALTLDGIGAYADRQTLEFADGQRRPVTLVGGLNGSGKTTLIRSLFHVLYGARGLSELGSYRSYAAYLADAVNHDREAATLELTLVIPGLRDSVPITVRRSWRGGGRGEQLDVFAGDAYDEELSESWDETIEQIAPLGVARLFFFDGEKIEALADLDSAAESLRTAVGSLLGLDLVSQLETDLVAVQRRVLRVSHASSSEALEEKQSELAAAERLTAEQRQRVEDLELELGSAEEELGRLQSAVRAAGGELVADRSELEAEAARSGEEEEFAWQGLRELASDPIAPLTFVLPLVERLRETAERDRREKVDENVVDVLATRDQWVITEAERLGLADVKKLRRLLSRDRDSRREASGADFAPLSSPEAIRAASEDHLTDWRVATIQAIDALDGAMKKTDDLDRRISRIPHDESVKILLEAAEKGRLHMEGLQDRLREAGEQLAAAERMKQSVRDRRDAELSRLADAEDGRERHQRVTQHAERAKQTLGRLSTRIAERHVGRIGDYTMQCLERLLRKDRLIQGVEIDPETFAVALFGSHGRLHPAALSAGERQLTALSLLWALARAAGRPLPVVIDTPLGRLDAGHREHVVGRYLPAASHQVVVLSTDTEIEADLHGVLHTSLGKQYRLSTDVEGRTEIVDGYFELASA